MAIHPVTRECRNCKARKKSNDSMSYVKISPSERMPRMQATQPFRHHSSGQLQPVRASSQCVTSYQSRAPALRQRARTPVRHLHEHQVRASEGSGALSPSIDQGLYGEHASGWSACHSCNDIPARLHAVQCLVPLLLPVDVPSSICCPSPLTLVCSCGSHSEPQAACRAMLG